MVSGNPTSSKEKKQKTKRFTYLQDRRRIREARTNNEVAWLKGEGDLINSVFKAAGVDKLDEAERLKSLISTSPVSRGRSPKDGPAKGGPTDAESPHEKFLDKWRIAVTVALVLALFAVVILVIVYSPTSTTKKGVTISTGNDSAPYVSLLSGIAGIALGWMFAQATGIGQRNRDSSRTNDNRGGTPPGGGTPPRRNTTRRRSGRRNRS